MLKIGYLMPFYIIKNLPDHDSYLVGSPGSNVLAQLPHKYAFKQYMVGETGWGALFSIDGPRITLSQKSPHYIRRVLEYLLSFLYESHEIRIKRIASVQGADFCKVSVESDEDSSSGIFALCKELLKENADEYFSCTICFVKYAKDRKEYIINALAPAPAGEIAEVIYFRDLHQATVFVNKEHLGKFMGAKGANVATAAKLVGARIDLKGI